MSDFVARFCRPLIEGGPVELGLPLADETYAQLLADGLGDPALRASLHRRAQVQWYGCGAPDPRIIGVFAAAHDMLVQLHPGSARFAPGRRYLSRLAARTLERDDDLPHDAEWLVHRWVVFDAATQLSRDDTFVELRYLGEVAGYGEAPELWDLPWRVVEGERTDTVTAADALDMGLAGALAYVSPLTNAQLSVARGRTIDAPSTLEPAFMSDPLARWLVRAFVDGANGPTALVRTLGETEWRDPAQLRRWLGLALYLHRSLTPDQVDQDWRALIASLAPHATRLGSAPIHCDSAPMRWHHRLLERAELEAA